MERVRSRLTRMIIKLVTAAVAIAAAVFWLPEEMYASDSLPTIQVSGGEIVEESEGQTETQSGEGEPEEEHQVICSEIEDTIYATLRNAGYSHAGVCGIMGNMAVENPWFKADLEGNKGITYGLFQWNDVGGRRSLLTRWCNNRKLYPNRVDGQLAFALYELSGGDSIAVRCNEFLKRTDDPRAAGMEFAVGFERCIGSTGNPDMDGVYRGVIYPEHDGSMYQALTSRMDKAESYYNIYLGFMPDKDLIMRINIVPVAKGTLEGELFGVVEVDTKPLIWTCRIMCLVIGYFCGCIFLTRIIKPDGPLSNFEGFGKSLQKARKRHQSAATVLGADGEQTGYLNDAPPRSLDDKQKDVYKNNESGPMESRASGFRNDRQRVRQSSTQRNRYEEIRNRLNEEKRAAIRKSALVGIGDILKTLLAFGICYLITTGTLREELFIWTGLGVIIGNDYPFWNKFKGGIGTTVTAVCLCSYMPIWGPVCCLIGMLVMRFTGSIAVGALAITATVIPFAFVLRGFTPGMLVIATMALIFVKLRHYLAKFILRPRRSAKRDSGD